MMHEVTYRTYGWSNVIPFRGDGFPLIIDQTHTCGGIVSDYIYGTWWRCRNCGSWKERVPA
jgi:hypothetical protein